MENRNKLNKSEENLLIDLPKNNKDKGDFIDYHPDLPSVKNSVNRIKSEDNPVVSDHVYLGTSGKISKNETIDIFTSNMCGGQTDGPYTYFDNRAMYWDTEKEMYKYVTKRAKENASYINMVIKYYKSLKKDSPIFFMQEMNDRFLRKAFFGSDFSLLELAIGETGPTQEAKKKAEDHNKPILIKQGNQFSIFGYRLVSGFDLCLMTIDSVYNLSSELMEKLLIQNPVNQNLSILIRDKQNKFKMWGCSHVIKDGKAAVNWCLRDLPDNLQIPESWNDKWRANITMDTTEENPTYKISLEPGYIIHVYVTQKDAIYNLLEEAHSLATHESYRDDLTWDTTNLILSNEEKEKCERIFVYETMQKSKTLSNEFIEPSLRMQLEKGHVFIEKILEDKNYVFAEKGYTKQGVPTTFENPILFDASQYELLDNENVTMFSNPAMINPGYVKLRRKKDNKILILWNVHCEYQLPIDEKEDEVYTLLEKKRREILVATLEDLPAAYQQVVAEALHSIMPPVVDLLHPNKIMPTCLDITGKKKDINVKQVDIKKTNVGIKPKALGENIPQNYQPLLEKNELLTALKSELDKSKATLFAKVQEKLAEEEKEVAEAMNNINLLPVADRTPSVLNALFTKQYKIGEMQKTNTDQMAYQIFNVFKTSFNKKLQEYANEGLVIGGDWNVGFASPEDTGELVNIGTGITYPCYHKDKIQGIVFIDGILMGYLNPNTFKYEIEQAKPFQMNPRSGMPYGELPPLDTSNVPSKQAEEIISQKPLVKLGWENFYKERKLLNDMTLSDFEEELKKIFPWDNRIIVRVTKNVNNQRGFSVRFCKDIANPIISMLPYFPELQHNEVLDFINSDFISFPKHYSPYQLSLIFTLGEIKLIASDTIKTNKEKQSQARHFLRNLMAHIELDKVDQNFAVATIDMMFQILYPNIGVRHCAKELENIFTYYQRQNQQNTDFKLIHDVAHYGLINVMLEMVNHKSTNINEETKQSKKTPLSIAIEHGQVNIVFCLIAKKSTKIKIADLEKVLGSALLNINNEVLFTKNLEMIPLLVKAFLQTNSKSKQNKGIKSADLFIIIEQVKQLITSCSKNMETEQWVKLTKWMQKSNLFHIHPDLTNLQEKLLKDIRKLELDREKTIAVEMQEIKKTEDFISVEPFSLLAAPRPERRPSNIDISSENDEIIKFKI